MSRSFQRGSVGVGLCLFLDMLIALFHPGPVGKSFASSNCRTVDRPRLFVALVWRLLEVFLMFLCPLVLRAECRLPVDGRTGGVGLISRPRLGRFCAAVGGSKPLGGKVLKSNISSQSIEALPVVSSRDLWRRLDP